MEKIKINFSVDNNALEEEQMYKEFLANPQAVKDIEQLNIPSEVIRKNIAKIYNFVLDLNFCKKCPGCDKCTKENPCFVTKISYEDGLVEQSLVPCKKLTQKMAFQEQFVIRDYDAKWVNDSFKEMDKNKERALAVQKFTAAINGGANWIYLTGGINSGRSYVAALMTNDFAKKGKGKIAYINTPKRIKELNDLNYSNKDEFQAQLELLSSVPLLVFDDFGSEYKNDFIRDAVLLEIIQKRASKKLLTIFTSDFTISEIQEMYSLNTPGKIRAKQLATYIKQLSGSEINLGDLPIY